jgi:hypothetical protein
MRKTTSLFALPLLCVSLAAPAAPKLEVPAPEYDFGKVRGEPVIEHEFSLKNSGNETLNIHRIKTSCGCTTPGIQALIIPAGETVTLPVKLDLKGKSGDQRQFITLSTNDPDNRTFSLKITGKAVPAVEISPRILNFDDIDQDNPPSEVITLTSTDEKPFTVTRATSNNNRVKIEIIPQADKLKTEIKITPLPQPNQGNFSEVVVIDTDAENVTDKRVVIMWKVQTGVSVFPSSMNIIMNPNARPLQKFFKVSAPEDIAKNLVVTDAQWPGRDSIELVTTKIERGWRVHIKNIVPEESMNGEQILIKTNHPAFPELKVPIRIISR